MSEAMIGFGILGVAFGLLLIGVIATVLVMAIRKWNGGAVPPTLFRVEPEDVPENDPEGEPELESEEDSETPDISEYGDE